MVKDKGREDPSRQTGIKIFVHGLYYYKTETARGAKPYTLEVRAASLEMFREESKKYMGMEEDPTTHLQKEKFKINRYLNIRGQLKKRLLPILLSRKFPDFARVRYVTIDEIVSLDGKELDLPVNLRSRAQLSVMITKEGFPIDPAEYLEVDDLRADILQYIQEPDAFLYHKPLKDKRRQEERAFLEMNDLNDVSLPPVRTQTDGPKGSSKPGGGVLDD